MRSVVPSPSVRGTEFHGRVPDCVRMARWPSSYASVGKSGSPAAYAEAKLRDRLGGRLERGPLGSGSLRATSAADAARVRYASQRLCSTAACSFFASLVSTPAASSPWPRIASDVAKHACDCICGVSANAHMNCPSLWARAARRVRSRASR